MSTIQLNASDRRETTIEGADRIFRDRWSPRAMSGDALQLDELMPLLEAARWAPSCFNTQPWRFLYALKGDPHWQLFFDLLIEFNQQWATNAGALIAIVSRNQSSDGKEIPCHSFDTGAAWMSLALQAHHSGLVAHAMQGFDLDAARTQLAITDDFAIEAMVAIGKPGSINDLHERMRDKEVPSDRKPLQDIVCHGPLKTS